jgi:hypothetical protein
MIQEKIGKRDLSPNYIENFLKLASVILMNIWKTILSFTLKSLVVLDNLKKKIGNHFPAPHMQGCLTRVNLKNKFDKCKLQ